MVKPIKPDFTSRETVQDRCWWAMCDSGMSIPVPLSEADLQKPFVYDRRYGVFYVPMGKHHFAMALILAWDLGVYGYLDIDYESLGISEYHSNDVFVYSDMYLSNTPGSCYLSSQSKSVKAASKGRLNERELDYFGLVDYLDE